MPTDKESLARFKELMLPAWQHTMQTEWRPNHPLLAGPKSESGSISGLNFQGTYVLEVGGTTEIETKEKEKVIILGLGSVSEKKDQDEFSKHYSGYNRTALQAQAGRLIEFCGLLCLDRKVERLVIVGKGADGMAALMAAPAADAVVVDCNGLDPASDEALLVPGLFAPGLRCIGSYQGAAMLAAPHRLLLHNTQGKFPTADIEAAYRAAGAEGALQISTTLKTPEEILAWAAQK